ncbi:MAG: uroporphyrinogen decarboxylase [Chloroflexales bacterium]|nr:uroporphyrinogen decarboxylase [Chloroflexales bacterium]
MSMTHRERMAAAIAGTDADRAPVALWRHFPVDDADAEQLALSVAAFQYQYDWDLIKLTPLSNYSVADWGSNAVYRGHPEGTSERITSPISSPADWESLQPLDPHTGALGRQLKCIRRLRELVGPDIPILETVFNPLSQARHLISAGMEVVHLRQHPQQLTAALEAITATTVAFVQAALEAGADGIFYAIQHARATVLSPDEYRETCRALDLRILEAASPGSLNLLHLHGQNTYFELCADYPVHALNWHDRETGPSLAEGAQRFAGLVVGGLSQADLVEGNSTQIHELAQQAIAATGGRRVCLSTGCVLPTVAPWGNIRALRAAVET